MIQFRWWTFLIYFLIVVIVSVKLGKKLALSKLLTKDNFLGNLVFFVKGNHLEDLYVDFDKDINRIDFENYKDTMIFMNTKTVDLIKSEGLNEYIKAREDCDNYKKHN